MDNFPLDSFKLAARELRRPFTSKAVKFKVQVAYPKGNPDTALVVSYIDSRLVTERLNLVVPDLWSDDYQEIKPGLLMCRLTIDGITRRDVGEGVGKGLYSDAFKRAAVKFGIGVSLYATPQQHLKVADGQAKKAKDTLVLTPKGEQYARHMYDAWLTATGNEAFGEPLDHGDVEDSTGDMDADLPQQTLAAAEPPEINWGDDDDLAAQLREQFTRLNYRRSKVRMALAECDAQDDREKLLTSLQAMPSQEVAA